MEEVVKRLRKLVVAVLPVVALVATSTPASAAPDVGAAACNPNVSSYISNQGVVGVGVIRSFQGWGPIYRLGYYDEVLPIGQRTDCVFGWTVAQGFYNGPGYCVELKTPDAQNRWYVWGRVTVSDQHRMPDLGRGVERWEANAYRC